MEQLQHFSHEHLLSLLQFQPDHKNENSDNEDEDEDEDEDKDDFVVEDHRHVGKCKMCKEEIYSIHICYYCCKDCDYSLHKFCAELPLTQQNHPSHPDHTLTLSLEFQMYHPDLGSQPVDDEWTCYICRADRKMFFNYHCSICKFSMDIICATISDQKMNHPSHPHQLQRYIDPMISHCHACSRKHSGTFYHCTTCFSFKIHLDCALLSPKLLIQKFTNESFSHPHFLTLAFFFPYSEQMANFFPNCRVCSEGFFIPNWHYMCNKCRYYVHVNCATSYKDAIMSILMPAGLGKTYKNFKDDDHPNLIRYPFPDESVNLLMHLFINKGAFIIEEKIDGEAFSHPHALVLFDTVLNKSVSLHDPMKKVELLCDGCVRPIMKVPFYKCSQQHCDFVLHKWCTRLPSEIQDHHDHPEHTLVLVPKIPTKFLGLFKCKISRLQCNGFAYGCKQCEYYVDINCGFIPDVITHEAHPNRLLLRFRSPDDQDDQLGRVCKACSCYMDGRLGFHCPTCDFYLHIFCALLVPRTIRHKCDEHPLSLRYEPVENHLSEYFCDICEDEFNPENWFYHCSTCALRPPKTSM